MDIKPITEEQKAVLKAAAAGGIESQASIYPAPSVQPVNAFGVLQPSVTGINTVEFVVSYPDMPNNDIILFYWNGDVSMAPAMADAAFISVSVPPALVIAASDQNINIIYSVITDDHPNGVPSAVHTQVVEKYTPPVYPAPVMPEAQDGVLNVTALSKNANVRVPAWPGIAAGQKIWLSMTSTPPINLTKWVGFPITSTGPQTTNISLDKLKTLVDGSSIELQVDVELNNDGTKTAFPPTRLVVRTAPELVFDPSDLLLNGRLLLWSGKTIYNWPANTRLQRVATGGTPPYSYSSSHPEIATVDGDGLVTSQANGTATITVVDVRGQSKSYQAVVSNVVPVTYHGALYYPSISFYRVPELTDLQLMTSIYNTVGRNDPDWGHNGSLWLFWSSTNMTNGSLRGLDMFTGALYELKTGGGWAPARVLYVPA
ncbi:MAG: Ig-like domain-containing protein [Pseudomonas sp.]